MQQNAKFIRKLPIPMDIKKEFPVTEEVAKVREVRVEEMRAILDGRDSRLMLIIGPCSADREDSVMDYVCRLVPLQEKVKDKILIVPRIYTNKPRTNGSGYKGMLHQPDPSKKPDMLEGIIAIRRLHTRAVQETGFACADEMLYPENYRYLSDILGYVAVGARSVENQQHRLVASGIDVPVGMKNPTGGDLSVMMNSIYAAMGDHTFLYRGWEVETAGNPYAHAIMRGYVNEKGDSRPTTTTMKTWCSCTSCTRKRASRTPPASSTATTPTPASSIWSRSASRRRSCTPSATRMISTRSSRA